jgi:anti-sigma regulatory factor (Ser/Thr protein kinase)
MISDKGPGIDFSILPKATLLSGFSTKQSLGMGFSFMLEFCDRVLLSTQPGNTIIVLEITAPQKRKRGQATF